MDLYGQYFVTTERAEQEQDVIRGNPPAVRKQRDVENRLVEDLHVGGKG